MEYMDLLPPTAPASFSRARLARPVDSLTAKTVTMDNSTILGYVQNDRVSFR